MIACHIDRIIGITGGIGSGKSVVSRILRLNGERVYDCDSEARRLMESDPEVKDRLRSLLGEGAYTASGRLDRGYVASAIFSDSVLRDGVNRIVHAAVKEDFLRFVESSDRISFCESAILATSHLDELCGSIWLVTAPEQQRIERVRRRNGLPDEEILRRIESQRDEFKSLPAGKVVGIMNGDDDMILPRLQELLGCASSESLSELYEVEI